MTKGARRICPEQTNESRRLIVEEYLVWYDSVVSTYLPNRPNSEHPSLPVLYHCRLRNLYVFRYGILFILFRLKSLERLGYT